MISVSFSSGQANFIWIAFRPKARGFSSKEMFCAPCSSSAFCADDFIFSRSASGESGITLAITATVDMIMFEKESL